MRTTMLSLIAVALGSAALMVGCRTQPLDHPFTDDFGTVNNNKNDMSMSKFDLAMPNGSSCSDLLTCLSGCNSQQCQNQCFSDATPEAQDLLTQTLDCVYGFCQNQDGNRPPRCDENFEDFGDGGTGQCDACLTNAFAQLGGYDCQPKNSPDCNPAACQSLVQTCLAQ